tara:strand:- start:466 stop:807 length:342 start_codon:yes stop_codon:yes gene_type:complete
MGIYFSVDYRSPPSGFGQIVDPSKPMTLSGGRWNYTLIAFKGCGQRDDPSYKETYYINTENWRQIVIQTYHTLKQLGVTEVYDCELRYQQPSIATKENGNYDLETWYQTQLGE